MNIINYEKKRNDTLTYEENRSYEEQEVCHICEGKFCTIKYDGNYKNRKKVKDHCHYTGKVSGAAHSNHNLKYKVPNNIQIVTHNAHFIINQLAEEFKEDLDCIGKNMDKYITFSVPIKNVMMVKKIQKD